MSGDIGSQVKARLLTFAVSELQDWLEIYSAFYDLHRCHCELWWITVDPKSGIAVTWSLEP